MENLVALVTEVSFFDLSQLPMVANAMENALE
jgi:hypothetical protein